MSAQPCPSPPPAVQTGVVVFSAAEFKTAYPAFTTVADGLLQGDFDAAALFLNNSCCSVVKDVNKRQRLLYLLTAHIAVLMQGENGKPPSGLVGRIDKATEGSVSVSAAYVSQMSMTEAYFAQTQYGVLFWLLTATLRSFRYIPPPAQCCGPYPGNPWSRGGWY